MVIFVTKLLPCKDNNIKFLAIPCHGNILFHEFNNFLNTVGTYHSFLLNNTFCLLPVPGQQLWLGVCGRKSRFSRLHQAQLSTSTQAGHTQQGLQLLHDLLWRWDFCWSYSKRQHHNLFYLCFFVCGAIFSNQHNMQILLMAYRLLGYRIKTICDPLWTISDPC